MNTELFDFPEVFRKSNPYGISDPLLTNEAEDQVIALCDP